MPKYHVLVIQALHVLSTQWPKYLTSSESLLPNLTPVEQLLVADTQAISAQITIPAIQEIHPYLPTAYAQKMIATLVDKQVLEQTGEGTYRYSARASKHVAAIEATLQASLKTFGVLPADKADRLAVLITALVDGIAVGPNPVPTPIFNRVVRALTPADFALGQIQQRLVALHTYRDDAHVAAWTSEGYSPAAIRVATHLFHNIEMQPLARFLEIPLYYDEAYVSMGLDELQRAGDIVEISGGYQLSVKGATRRDHVEHLTNESFEAAFQNHLSQDSREVFSELMLVLIDTGRRLMAQNQSPASSATTTLKLPFKP